jgi:hypothetical protein
VLSIYHQCSVWRAKMGQISGANEHKMSMAQTSPLYQLLSHDLFKQPDSLSETGPFRRPLRPQDIHELIGAKPLTSDTLYSNAALLTHRTLTSVYEQELIFLPKKMPTNRIGGISDSSIIATCGSSARQSAPIWSISPLPGWRRRYGRLEPGRPPPCANI